MSGIGKMINVAAQHLLTCDVLGRKHVDGGVGACTFAHAAGGAVVVAVGVFDHFETATVTFVHLEGLLVLGVLFRHNAPRIKKVL